MSHIIGQIIRNLRRKHGVTQAELAAAVGVSMQAVSKWECGGTPDVELLPTIANFFGVSVDLLFGSQTVRDASLEVVIQQELAKTPEAKRMNRAAELVWAAMKGLAAIPNIQDLEFTEPHEVAADDCTRFHLLFDDGLAYGSGETGAASMFILPEPADGYLSLLGDSSRFSDLFATLGDPLQLAILYFFYGRRMIPCSVQHISNHLNEAEGAIAERLERMLEFGWVQAEEVELNSGPVTLYRPVLNVAFIAMVYFAGEVLRRTRLWYFSNVKRDKPVL